VGTYTTSLAVKEVSCIVALITGMDTGFRTIEGTQATLNTFGSIVGRSLGPPVTGAI
jgi:hypothetical protein